MATRLTIAVLGMLLAIWLGFLAGEGAILLIAAIALFISVFIFKFSLGRKLSMEGMLCLILLFGTLMGQKGFTYLRLTSVFFISEVFLAALLLIYVCNTILRHRPFIPNTWLARVISLFLIYSIIHLYFDYKKHHFMALRDSCLAYYTLFFILAYRISNQREILRLLERWLPIVFLLIALWYVPYTMIHSWAAFLHSIYFLGSVLFMFSTDVSMNVTFGAFFYFYWRFLTEKQPSYWVQGGLLLSCFSFIGAIRGTMLITCIVTVIIFLYFRGHSVIKHSLVTAAIVVVGIAWLFIAGGGKVQENMLSHLNLMTDEVKAIQLQILQDDTTKTMAEDNARWRVQWWKKLWADTMQTAPLTGMGFGVDIATPFHMEYHGVQQPAEEWSSIRGAHSALMTILARLGLIGVFFFLLIMGSIAHRVWLTMHLLQQKRLPIWYLAPTGYIVGGFVVSFFQYTWEAPYTAIPFWMMVGVLYAGTDKILRSNIKFPTLAPISLHSKQQQLSESLNFRKFRPDPLTPEKLLHRRHRQTKRKFLKTTIFP